MIDYSEDLNISHPDNDMAAGETPGLSGEDTIPTNITITNHEFLTSLFGNELADDGDPRQYAWITEFPDDPGNAKSAEWHGRKWDGKELAMPDDAPLNTFFSIALFKEKPEKESRLVSVKRRKANFSCLPCVILDDVGTKANESEIPPTWLIETSPGNYQAGYCLVDPIKSVGDAEILMQGLQSAESFTDTGGQNLTRYARLPVGFNTKAKYGEPFRHRLAVWEPSRRYDWRELAEMFLLDLEFRETPSKVRSPALRSSPNDDEVFSPPAEINPVIEALMAKGLYKKPHPHGKHEITCPWVHEHTDQLDNGTVYFEPSYDYSRGGFKCQHGHCSDRKIGHLLEFLQIDTQAAINKPTIRISGGTLHLQVDNTERLLAGNGDYFQSGGAIVRIVAPSMEETTSKPIKPHGMQAELTRMINWQRLDRRTETWGAVDAPKNVCNALLEATEYRYLPRLLAISHQPHMREDGSIVTTPGYDKATQIFGVFDGSAFQSVQDPGREDADAALGRILQLLEEFAFVTREDKAAAVAFILTAAVRPSLETAPAFLVSAHAPGSGKSYLQELACLFATEGQPASATFKTDDTEMEKVLIATLLETPAVIRFDESTTDLLPVKTLLSMLSSQFVKGRMLGFSKMVTPSTRTLVTFAGNNIQPVRDMVRRVLVIGLDVQSENPESREFESDPVSTLSQNRASFVMDALTIVRAHIMASPEAPECRALNGSPRWERWVRYAVIWMGLGDPCVPMFSKAADDPQREELGVLLAELSKTYGTGVIKVREMIKAAQTNDELSDVLCEIAPDGRGKIDNLRLGHYLKSNQGRIIDGHRLIKDTSVKRDAAAYRIEPVATGKTSME